MVGPGGGVAMIGAAVGSDVGVAAGTGVGAVNGEQEAMMKRHTTADRLVVPCARPIPREQDSRGLRKHQVREIDL
jgi:hypothetical protein